MKIIRNHILQQPIKLKDNKVLAPLKIILIQIIIMGNSNYKITETLIEILWLMYYIYNFDYIYVGFIKCFHKEQF
jgi:hypothetical protein